MSEENPNEDQASTVIKSIKEGLLENDIDKEKDNSLEEEDNLRVKVNLPRRVRWFLFFICFILNILMNVDHGTIPAATSLIRMDLSISDETLGIFGSLVFAGVIVGSLLSLALINRINRKYLFIMSLLLCAAVLWEFTIPQYKAFLFANRCITGVFQAFISIYFPVWCDQYGIETKKTMMISLVQIAPPIGVVLGYFLTTMFINNGGWKLSFIVQAISIGAFTLVLFFFPNNYFAINYRKENISTRKISFFYDERPKLSNKFLSIKDESTSFLQKMRFMFTQPIYIFCVLTVSCLLFCLTCIQYWGSDYMECILLVTNENQRLLSFSVVVLTSPTLGVLFGGMVISWFGGYESKHSLLICSFFSVGSVLCAIPVPLVSTLIMFSVLLWGMLFFGGAILAPLYGIIITSMPKEYAGYANTFTVFFGNLFGYLPGPFFFGALKDRLGAKPAMMISMYLSCSAGVLFIVIGTIFRYRHFSQIQSYSKSKHAESVDDNKANDFRIVDESNPKSENGNLISTAASRCEYQEVNNNGNETNDRKEQDKSNEPEGDKANEPEEEKVIIVIDNQIDIKQFS